MLLLRCLITLALPDDPIGYSRYYQKKEKINRMGSAVITNGLPSRERLVPVAASSRFRPGTVCGCYAAGRFCSDPQFLFLTFEAGCTDVDGVTLSSESRDAGLSLLGTILGTLRQHRYSRRRESQ